MAIALVCAHPAANCSPRPASGRMSAARTSGFKVSYELQPQHGQRPPLTRGSRVPEPASGDAKPHIGAVLVAELPVEVLSELHALAVRWAAPKYGFAVT